MSCRAIWKSVLLHFRFILILFHHGFLLLNEGQVRIAAARFIKMINGVTLESVHHLVEGRAACELDLVLLASESFRLVSIRGVDWVRVVNAFVGGL